MPQIQGQVVEVVLVILQDWALERVIGVYKEVTAADQGQPTFTNHVKFTAEDQEQSTFDIQTNVTNVSNASMINKATAIVDRSQNDVRTEDS